MRTSISFDLPPPPPPCGPSKPSLYELRRREMEIKTKLLEAQLMKATNPNCHVIGGEDDYVWDSKALKWIFA